MPNKILIQGVYPYEIPDFKGDEKNIINFDIKDKADQYWRKVEIPKKFKDKKSEIDWIWREEERLANGVHFLNNGELTYVNGQHYEFLTYYKNSFDVEYWDEHRKYFYFLEFSHKFPNAWGDFTIKARRAGVTQIHNSDTIRTARNNFSRFCGLMSTDLEKVKSVQFKPIRNALMAYPKQFRPLIKSAGGKLPERQIEFLNEKIDDEKLFLGGWIKPLATSPTAFDGEKLHKLKVDEVLKFMGVNPMTIITPQLKAMKLQHTGQIIGKCSMFSTMGIDDKAMKYAIDEGRKLWEGSNYEELNENGWTTSGFLRYFMSCYDIMEIDKYGFPNRELAEKKQEATLNQIIEKFGDGSKEHIRELRENPRTINDVFNSPKLGTTFNRSGRVSARKIYVFSTPPKQRGYLTGKFMEDVNGKIYFNTSDEYKNYGWKLNLTNIPVPNNVKFTNTGYKLPRNPEGVVGYDPVKLEETISDKISEAAILIYKKFDHYQKCGIENEIIGQFIGRLDDIDEISQQAGYAARYFGFWISPERNVGDKWFKRNMYNDMVVKSPYDGLKGILMQKSANKNVLRDGIELIDDYLKKPKDENGIDYLEKISFEELLSNLETFEADALNTHDLIAALIQCFIVSSKIMKGTAIGNGRTPTGNVFW
jgi:hypothetical protein